MLNPRKALIRNIQYKIKHKRNLQKVLRLEREKENDCVDVKELHYQQYVNSLLGSAFQLKKIEIQNIALV